MDGTRALPAHLAETQILARTIASTDSLVKRLREQQEENTKLKIVLGTVKKTASKVHKLYEKEKAANVTKDESLKRTQQELEEARRCVAALNHEIVNMDCVHRQTVEEVRKSAEDERISQEKVFLQLVREYLNSVQTLSESNLMDDKSLVAVRSMRSKLEGFEWLKDVLREFQKNKKQKGRKKSVESVEEVDILEARELEENLMCFESFESPEKEEIVQEMKEPEPEKSFCDRGTMTTSVTITRGTNTDKLKTSDVGTCFPEINLPSSYEEIFSQMIVDLPELLPEIPNAIMRDSATETDPEPPKMDAETITDLCNIRKVIGYRKRKRVCLPERVKVEDLKIEPASPRPDENLPLLHPQFDRLWSIMGQTLFAMLRNSTNDFVQSQYILEQENFVKQIFLEEMMKREAQVFPPGVLREDTEPPEEPMKVLEVVQEPPKVHRERIRQRIPQKRKRSNVILKSWKKIKLQRKIQERRDEDSSEEFDLEKIREFFALPPLLEPIDDLPEEVPAVSTPEFPPNCDIEKNEEPKSVMEESKSDIDKIEEPKSVEEAPERAPIASIMSFVHRHVGKRLSKSPDRESVGRCRVILLEYLQVEWVSFELIRFTDQMEVLKPDEGSLFEAVAEIIENTPDQLVFNPFGSLAPLIPRTHQQVIIFCHTVSRKYPEGLLRRLLHFLERRIFTLSAEKRTLKNLINLTHLLIALMDLQFGERFGKLPVRLFIFKCLYYFHHKAPPLIYMVLKAFPDALPVSEDNFEASETLILALRCSLVHLPPLSNAETEKPEFKKKELLQLLRNTYKYEPGTPSLEETTQILLSRLKTGSCHAISNSFTLLAKRMGVTWAKSLIQKHLIPTLNDILLQSPHEMRNHQIITLLNSISCMVKAFPNKEDISEFHRIYGCVLESIDSHHVQEAAIGAFLRLSRFGMVNVFSQIYQWRPREPISRQLAAALDTFIHRKAKIFWQTLERQIN